MTVRQALPKCGYAIVFGVNSNALGPIDGNGNAVSLGSTGAAKCPCPIAGTFRNLCVYSESARTDPFTVTVRKNSVPTALTVTVNTPDTLLISQESFSVEPGDYVEYAIAGTATFFPGYAVGFSLEWEGASMVFGLAAIAGTIGAGVGWSGGAFGNGVLQNYGGTPSLSNTYSICAIRGVVRQLMLRRFAAPSGGAWHAWIIKNQVIQDGSGGTVNTECVLDDSSMDPFAVSTFQLPCAPGEHFDVLILRAGTTAGFDLEHVGAGVAVSPTVPGQFMFCGGDNSTIPGTGTTWKWNDSLQNGADESMHDAPIGLRGFSVHGFYVERSADPGAAIVTHTPSRRLIGDSAVLQESLAVSLTGTARSGLASGHGRFPAGELITTQIDNDGANDGSSRYHWGVVASPGNPILGPIAWMEWKRAIP